ncbi:MAG: 4-hydroxythreonine-4-phosphate dehydrogenase PdxA [Sphingomonas sp. SCN 67-18]|uniref:4-hydroxythreonine-4-phosphate dehydrogenase PdxA n=1 Tax=uncultured Sphingomonas sp. TaxID=158754 RepID=UPI000869D714|nr:4-hydroxythreonine-4-phosphate dehydrogenase PdxA [Sphingomonas sp. SCN 67-18]ODU19522.1 MAG: 4-hydroxythreonine-4-phosphate dehydrogenase PdxA [Sphingomonas sp. SCN 67-18]
MNPLAVALGDPAGVGPEIVTKAWMQRDRDSLAPFFAVGDARSIAAVWQGPIVRIFDPLEAESAFSHGLPLIQVEDGGEIQPGEPNLEGARCSLDSLEMAAGLARSGAAGGLVTGPVSKSQLYAIGFTHPGQTEFVAERCGIARDNAVMMLVGPGLKVVPVTTHVPLNKVSSLLSIDLIVAKALATARGLTRNFGIENPRLAFAGLNPHAGEGGALGREEIDLLIPALEILRDEGISVSGPHAADTLFHARARANYDVAICLYHDQALIPLKTLYFDEGVNMTLGLPIVRTSPDHGTAFPIAGKNVAEPGAMIEAIRLAADAARCRCERTTV